MINQNLINIDNSNMNRLRSEIKKFESLNFEIQNISGYGEGVFTINVKMGHSTFGHTHLVIAQDAEDHSTGRVMFHPCSINDLFNSYEF